MSTGRFAEGRHAVLVPHGTGHSAAEQALVARCLALRIVLRVQNFLELPAIVSSTDLIALVPGSAARTLAVHHVPGQLPSPIEVPAFLVRQCWHERFHGDAANQWLRGAVAELFIEDGGAAKA